MTATHILFKRRKMSQLYRLKGKRLIVLAIMGCMGILYYLTNDCHYDLDLLWIIYPDITLESAEIKCYEEGFKNVLEELTTDTEVVSNTSIFFVETSCHYGALKLNPRQACAIESAAKMNPMSDVFLLFPSPISVKENNEEYFKRLMSYHNFRPRYINVTTFFNGTPLEKWYASGKLKSSNWPRSHMSDILRYTLLWKYGGIYLDLDVVILRSFNQKTNFAGAESETDVAAGVLSFSHNHKLTSYTMEDLRHNFRGHDWGWNGPGVITRTLKEYCEVCKVHEMWKDRCKDFTVFPPSAFYPITWRDWKKYFTQDEKETLEVMESIKDSYAIHVWNKHSKNEKIFIGSNQPYGKIAEKQCPRVYSSLKNDF